VSEGATVSFTITPDDGYGILDVTGCNGSLNGSTYTTGSIFANCTVTATFALPGQPALSLSAPKTFRFNWVDVSGASHYKLLENNDGMSGFTQVGANIAQGVQSVEHVVPLYARMDAQYILQACDNSSCSDSTPVSVSGSLANAVGYFKASNTIGFGMFFGYSISISGDGNTMAVGDPNESSGASGINGNQQQTTGTSSNETGAVYLFTRDGENWNQQAYIKASNPGTLDSFGASVSLSADGNTLVVGAEKEESNATGVNGNQGDNSVENGGAVYVFTRSGTSWSQQAYIKASNTGDGDLFGSAATISADGNTLAVGAHRESGDATGINGDGTSNGAYNSGAVYVFIRSSGSWQQQAYIKASNTGSGDYFGYDLALSSDGSTLAVGAWAEQSNASGIDGDQNDNSANSTGAVYVFNRVLLTWSQQAYLKASNANAQDGFGSSVSLSGDGNTLVVGAPGEGSNSVGVDQDQNDNSLARSGAAYVFTRSADIWAQQAYIKASNTGENDAFGGEVALTADGRSLAIGAGGEDSNAIGINGDQNDNSAVNSGAVYIFINDGLTWRQQAYVKASNTDGGDGFGGTVVIAGNGQSLAVGATKEASLAKGIGGNQTDNSSYSSAGAVYLY
jgi:hypothetical protein